MRERYESLGYKFTSYGDNLDVNVEHLSDGTTVETCYRCDNCGIKDKKRYVDIIRYERQFCSANCQHGHKLNNKELYKRKKSDVKETKKNTTKREKWSEEELSVMIKFYGNISTNEIENMLPKRTYKSITTKAKKMGLKTREYWSDDDIEKLKELFPIYETKDLELVFNRSTESIQVCANGLGLKKDKFRYEENTQNLKREKLLNDLCSFAKKLGRTPYQTDITDNKDMPGVLTYVRTFGSYSQACREAGLELNERCYGNAHIPILYSKNGDTCFSASEKQITDFMIDNKIIYRKDIKYRDIIDDPRCGQKRVDWIFEDNTIVEFFGMMGVDDYEDGVTEKITICIDNEVNLIQLYPSDLRNEMNGVKRKLNKYLLINKDAE